MPIIHPSRCCAQALVPAMGVHRTWTTVIWTIFPMRTWFHKIVEFIGINLAKVQLYVLSLQLLVYRMWRWHVDRYIDRRRMHHLLKLLVVLPWMHWVTQWLHWVTNFSFWLLHKWIHNKICNYFLFFQSSTQSKSNINAPLPVFKDWSHIETKLKDLDKVNDNFTPQIARAMRPKNDP